MLKTAVEQNILGDIHSIINKTKSIKQIMHGYSALI